jgi:hypothetical protein
VRVNDFGAYEGGLLELAYQAAKVGAKITPDLIHETLHTKGPITLVGGPVTPVSTSTDAGAAAAGIASGAGPGLSVVTAELPAGTQATKDAGAPVQASLFGLSTTTLLIFGGVGLAAALFLKGRR